jgi:hypothetical protein
LFRVYPNPSKILTYAVQAGSEFFDSLFYGIFIGLCLIALIYAAQLGRFWYLLRHKFHKSTFDVFLSSSSDEANYTVACEVKKHSIFFTAKSPAGITLFNGEFIMNPLNLKFGEGYYHRVKNDNGSEEFEAYGFMKVIVKNDWTFLVEDQNPLGVDPAVKTSKTLAHPAIVWKRT